MPEFCSRLPIIFYKNTNYHSSLDLENHILYISQDKDRVVSFGGGGLCTCWLVNIVVVALGSVTPSVRKSNKFCG